MADCEEKCRKLERDVAEKDLIIQEYQTRESDTRKEMKVLEHYIEGKNRECEGYIAKIKSMENSGPGSSVSSVEVPGGRLKFFEIFDKRFTLEEIAADGENRHKKILRTVAQFL